MKVQVKFFAILRERVGAAEITKELPEGSKVQYLWELLQKDYPQLPSAKMKLLYAVNKDYVNGDRILKDLDEVVFIPPVSGG